MLTHTLLCLQRLRGTGPVAALRQHETRGSVVDPELGVGEPSPAEMNRIPVYEVIDERPVAVDEAARGTGVFRPLTGDECTVTLTDVRPFDCFPSDWLSDSDGGKCTRRLMIGEADCAVDRGLEAVVRGMGTGEMREFCVGDGRGGRVAGRVELSAVRKGQGTVGADDQLKLAHAVRHKKAGNRLYEQRRYADAFHRFNRAVRYVLFLRDVNASSMVTTRDALYASVCNNMAACQLHAANYEHVVRLCTKVLAVEPDNLKALVRRCRASVELKSYDDAAADAQRVLDREPGNAEAKRCLDVAERGIRAQNANYRDMVKKMFP